MMNIPEGFLPFLKNIHNFCKILTRFLVKNESFETNSYKILAKFVNSS